MRTLLNQNRSLKLIPIVTTKVGNYSKSPGYIGNNKYLTLQCKVIYTAPYFEKFAAHGWSALFSPWLQLDDNESWLAVADQF